jgi:two-component sensor histidine kinase
MSIQLTPQAALASSLTIHELATNAAKYGPLSVGRGMVAVAWRHSSDGSVEMEWQESGGPEVRPPKKRGFGSTLMERAFAMETGGPSTLEFLPAGVLCRIALPASSLVETPRNETA